jgi:hypothetical protein
MRVRCHLLNIQLCLSILLPHSLEVYILSVPHGLRTYLVAFYDNNNLKPDHQVRCRLF